jgi:phage tail protein X
MQSALWKVLLAGFLLSCLAGFLVWLNRDSGQPDVGTSESGLVQKSIPEASPPPTSSKTGQTSKRENKPLAVPVETGAPSAGTLSTSSHSLFLGKSSGHETEGVEGLTSSVGTRGKAEFEEIVTVKAGENIFALCRRYYGLTNATLMDIVLDFNPGLENAHFIRVNQKIKLPRMTEELLILENSDQTYHIHAGTFADPDASRRYSDVSALRGKDIEVIPRKVSPGDTWYRVVIGRFDNREEALKMIRLLKGRGLVPSSRVESDKETPGKPGSP